jgi:hypothetical protein
MSRSEPHANAYANTPHATWDMAKTLRPVPPFRASLFDLAYSKLRTLISICNTVLKARGTRAVVIRVFIISPRITVFVTISTTFLGFVLGSADRIVVVVPSFDVVITTSIPLIVPFPLSSSIPPASPSI